MRLAILSAGMASPDRVRAMQERKDYRKATPNMLLATAAILDLQPAALTDPAGPGLATILATGHGELGSSIHFLRDLSRGMARPFLFQSTLHNATLGFVTRQFGLSGPSFTVSQGPESGESALELADDLIGAGIVSACLVIGVDAQIEGYASYLLDTYPEGTRLCDGAGALLLGAGDRPAGAYLTSLRRGSEKAPTDGKPFYDSDPIEKIARAFRAEMPGEVRLEKPDGSISYATWERQSPL